MRYQAHDTAVLNTNRTAFSAKSYHSYSCTLTIHSTCHVPLWYECMLNNIKWARNIFLICVCLEVICPLTVHMQTKDGSIVDSSVNDGVLSKRLYRCCCPQGYTCSYVCQSGMNLTHWPLGDLDAILKLKFPTPFYWLVSSHRWRIMPCDEYHGTSQMISQHWSR